MALGQVNTVDTEEFPTQDVGEHLVCAWQCEEMRCHAEEWEPSEQSLESCKSSTKM